MAIEGHYEALKPKGTRMADPARKDCRPTGPIDPVAAAIADYFGTDPVWQALRTAPAAETRAAIRAATPMLGLPAMAHIEDFRIDVAGGDIGLRLYRPAADCSALILWAHGGGFVLGSADETDNFARALAAESGCVVASIEYRLAPEHRFPTAVDDVEAAIRWIAERQVALWGTRLPLIVGGDSAGANLATVATRRLHAAGRCVIAGNILAYPCTDHGDTGSLERFDPPFLSAAEFRWFQEQYLPAPDLRDHPDFAPIRADDLDRLPPTLVITAEHDIVTEQAEAYAQKLADAGVPVQVSRHPGMIHGFLTLPMFFDGAAGTAMREIARFVTDRIHPVIAE